MRFTALVPARMTSTRLPRKPLADICGKPMVVRTAERALASGAQAVAVACDSEDIVKACGEHGIQAILTNPNHPTGTDRLSEAVAKLGLADDEIVVNVQGDEPLIPPAVIASAAAALVPTSSRSFSTKTAERWTSPALQPHGRGMPSRKDLPQFSLPGFPPTITSGFMLIAQGF